MQMCVASAVRSHIAPIDYKAAAISFAEIASRNQLTLPLEMWLCFLFDAPTAALRLLSMILSVFFNLLNG